ncbi:hypothetical protein CAEBREN_07873 [Caenorhabditis brenneri]|uniref:F-box domain-containing protein n=1 Tax=Caenorhabditis brenneri TaxID=135651 RepID=G0MIS1_CAEBE|nr:hypothetical protein CAEBREN_07873 [Caenorhabditis brenneri]
MNRFPVLRLPYVALREVIESTDKSDVLNLALASRKMCKLIDTTRNSVSMKKLSQDDIDKLGVMDRYNITRLETLHCSEHVRKELEVNISKEPSLTVKTFYAENDIQKSMTFRVHVDFAEDRPVWNQKVMRFGNLDVPVASESNDTVHTLWNNSDCGVGWLCCHFFQKFDLKRFSSLEINPEDVEYSEFSTILRSVVDLVKETPEGPNLQILRFGLLTAEDSQYLFDGVKYKDIIVMGRRIQQNSGAFTCESSLFLLGDADWFSLENLMSTKCEIIILRGSQMTNDLIKQVLMHWMDKKLEKLAHLSVELREEVDIESILSGLSNRTGYVLTRTKESVTIRRGDGKRAEILIPKDESEKKTFKMISC